MTNLTNVVFTNTTASTSLYCSLENGNWICSDYASTWLFLVGFIGIIVIGILIVLGIFVAVFLLYRALNNDNN